MKEISDLKVLIISSEAAPFAKSGGLGDVVGSLPKALKDLGVDVRVVIPKYKTIPEKYFQGIRYLGAFETHLSWRKQKAGILYKDWDFPVYFIENDYYFGRDGYYGYNDDFERFAYFSRAAIDMLPLIDFFPDIIHCNDWQTGLVSMYIKEIYNKFVYLSNVKTLYTIHNLQYQGRFGKEIMDILEAPYRCFSEGNMEFYGDINYMKTGLVYSDVVSTVSKKYAEEITTPEYGYGLDGVIRSRKDDLYGIVNGIDYDTNNPATDKRIFTNFDVNSIELKKENKFKLQQQLGLEVRDVPVISVISRLAEQKGVDILASAFDEIMSEDVQFILLGTGTWEYENIFKSFGKKYSGRVSSNIMFDDTLAQRIYAGSDLFLMPSLFEPCGLGQMFALRYGTIPLVRRTGGLDDTIKHYNTQNREGNGFVFETYDKGGLLWAFREAIKTYYMEDGHWQSLVKNAMNCQYSWKHSASEYIKLYLSMVNGL